MTRLVALIAFAWLALVAYWLATAPRRNLPDRLPINRTARQMQLARDAEYLIPADPYLEWTRWAESQSQPMTNDQAMRVWRRIANDINAA